MSKRVRKRMRDIFVSFQIEIVSASEGKLLLEISRYSIKSHSRNNSVKRTYF